MGWWILSKNNFTLWHLSAESCNTTEIHPRTKLEILGHSRYGLRARGKNYQKWMAKFGIEKLLDVLPGPLQLIGIGSHARWRSHCAESATMNFNQGSPLRQSQQQHKEITDGIHTHTHRHEMETEDGDQTWRRERGEGRRGWDRRHLSEERWEEGEEEWGGREIVALAAEGRRRAVTELPNEAAADMVDDEDGGDARERHCTIWLAD